MTEEQEQAIIECYLRAGTYEKVRQELGHSPSTIWKVIKKAGLCKGRGKNQKYKITDEQILEDISQGLTRQEIANKRNIHVGNLDRRMKKLGVHARYADRQNEIAADTWHYHQSSEQFVVKNLGDSFDFIAYKRSNYKIRCKLCGDVIVRNKSSIRRQTVICKNCKQKEKERIKSVRSFCISQSHKCSCCNKEFYSPYSTSIYSSETCKRKAKRMRYKTKYPERVKERKRKYNDHGHHIHRAKQYGCDYEYGITLKKVIQKDDNICQICHKPCNLDDKSYGEIGKLYPSIDHIIPLSKGGSHTWNNVQLAHMICNSYKRDLFTV